eukprot:GDKJ01054814.1.p1 GENE.GDKJ01054814.1~~GDKJ01054814.1.p1  ORF type:complete len:407 (+),score=86.55 GDKJ01054814.1:194-1414(+)
MFTPFELTKKVHLKHRIVMPPLTRARANYGDGIFGPNSKTYYQQRASEGGLLISEATLISPVARGWDRAPGIWLPEHEQMWTEVADAVHEKNGYIYMQLWHMGRAASSELQPNGQPPKSASAVNSEGAIVFGKGNRMLPMETPVALTTEEVYATIEDYYKATLRAKAAGMDGVEVHNANGYLLQQFLSTNVNLRTDEFGGSIENRCRFPLLVLRAATQAWLGLPLSATDNDIRAAVVAQYGSEDARVDVGVRYSPFVKFNALEEQDAMELYPYLLKQVETLPAKLAYVHVVEPRADGVEDAELGEKTLYAHSKEIVRPYFSGAVMSAGGYSRDPYSGEQTITDGAADLIAIGRAFISNPDLVERLRSKTELRAWDRDVFYTDDEVKGYIDYTPARTVGVEQRTCVA